MERADRVNPQTCLIGLCDQLLLPRPRHRVQPDDDMQPGLGADHRGRRAKGLGQGGEEHRTTFTVPAADPPHMPLIGAALDQLGQRLLFEPRRMPVGQPLCLGKGRRQRLRNDEVAKAQGWRERLGNRAEIDDPIAAPPAPAWLGSGAMSKRYSLS